MQARGSAAWWEALAESDDVGSGGGEDVLDVGPREHVVAAVTQAMGVAGAGACLMSGLRAFWRGLWLTADGGGRICWAAAYAASDSEFRPSWQHSRPG